MSTVGMPASASRARIICASSSLLRRGDDDEQSRPQPVIFSIIQPSRSVRSKRVANPLWRAQPLDVVGDLGSRAGRRRAAARCCRRATMCAGMKPVSIDAVVAEVEHGDAGLARVDAEREERELLVLGERRALAEAGAARGAVGGRDLDRVEVVDERAEAVEDRLAAVELDAAQGVVVAAHDGVGAVLDGVAGERELVVLEHLHPARVAPVRGDDRRSRPARGPRRSWRGSARGRRRTGPSRSPGRCRAPRSSGRGRRSRSARAAARARAATRAPRSRPGRRVQKPRNATRIPLRSRIAGRVASAMFSPAPIVAMPCPRSSSIVSTSPT